MDARREDPESATGTKQTIGKQNEVLGRPYEEDVCGKLLQKWGFMFALKALHTTKISAHCSYTSLLFVLTRPSHNATLLASAVSLDVE